MHALPLLALGWVLSFSSVAEARPQPSKPAVRHRVEHRTAQTASPASPPALRKTPLKLGATAARRNISKPAAHQLKMASVKRAEQAGAAPAKAAVRVSSAPRYPASKPAVRWLRKHGARS